jgi:hypothetical protein
MDSSYSLLLRDPRWQRKRLEIFNRDAWACTRCSDEFTNLQVHHLYYNHDKYPWDYPDDALITLCDLCHAKAEFYKWLHRTGIMSLKRLGFPQSDIVTVLEVVHGQLIKKHRQAAFEYMNDIKRLMYG